METRTEERISAPPQTMRAVRIHAYGGVDAMKYESVPCPVPGEGEVLVRVHAAAVNPVDWKIRQGLIPGHKLPLILGWDFSGVVESADPASEWRRGDAVYSRPDIMRDGAYAEYIVVKESELARKPESLDHVNAASIPLAGLTAWQALFEHGELKEGQRVLVHAASGGVGMYAVQLAKWRGAYVIATASEKNRDFVLSLGADEFIDYTSARPEDAVREMDLVLDTVGAGTSEKSLITLKKGGVIVSTVEPPSEEKARAVGVRAASFMAATRADELAELAKLADAGKLKTHVGRVFQLSEAWKAHELSQSHHARGKIVLSVE